VNCTAASVSSSGSSRGPAADAGTAAWVSMGGAGKRSGGRSAGPEPAGNDSGLAVD
jgi:hypothetical protein